ncbi:hypothetical protein OJ587_11405, partial [Streptococcus anginosus]|nr:hypothetical protein [Streptococcus anginosus]
MACGRSRADKRAKKAQREVDAIMAKIDELRGQAERTAKKAQLKGKRNQKKWEHKAKSAASDFQDYAKQA